MTDSYSRYRKDSLAWTDDLPSLERRRTRSDWAGIGLGDAFRFGNDYRVRLSALQLMNKAIRDAQRSVAAYAGGAAHSASTPRIKPQLSPCYTSYPARMASYAAIGLTAYLEYRELSSDKLLELCLKDYLQDPATADGVEINAAIYKELVQRITRCVQTRLLLEDLSRAQGLAAVEAYRLFAAAHSSRTPWTTVMEMVQAVVLFGDILPAQLLTQGHPMTRGLAAELSAICGPYLQRLQNTRSDQLLDLGCEWTKALCVCLVVALSAVTGQEQEDNATKPPASRICLDTDASSQDGPNQSNRDLIVPPQDESRRPDLFGSTGIDSLLGQEGQEAQHPMSEQERDLLALRKHLGEETEEERRERTVKQFSQAATQAAGLQAKWEDPRSDLIELIVGIAAFEKGPVEGNLIEGHQVMVRLDENEIVTGEQFDCLVELSDDIVAYAELMNTSQPTIKAIRRILYPSVELIPVTQRICTSGMLDPARLALGDASSAVYRRNRMTPLPDRRGRALLVIACDGSGSLNPNQMKVLKILACSWLVATSRSEVQVLAGLYHSGSIRSGMTGPLVQWIAHPKQTPAVSNTDAVRALLTLPRTGTGIQSDALSLAFIMDEARKLTSGTIYLIHITDCEWNESFGAGKSGAEEVRSLMQSWRNEPKPPHITMVALGVSGETGLESMVDKTITLSELDLQDSSAVADKIGQYVASCIAERHRLAS